MEKKHGLVRDNLLGNNFVTGVGVETKKSIPSNKNTNGDSSKEERERIKRMVADCC
jgi:hypothetical protein